MIFIRVQQNYVLERCQKISNHNSLKKATLILDRYIVYLSTYFIGASGILVYNAHMELQDTENSK